ncbi:hypothetical protein Acr_00g0037220 [Actinidia rufa]|uniref:Transposase (putative) gypsy type domain-containing protein n=1 Tax=Actinidia rufa TaxID=165716 RepID=A0A7J0DHY3_9ERIC|nr:hypothetical protein Acr_00g0037220 [Actinidia rufa]
MLFEEQTAIIGDVMEERSHGARFLMGVEYLVRRSGQPRPLAKWRTNDALTKTGNMSTSRKASPLTRDAEVRHLGSLSNKSSSSMLMTYACNDDLSTWEDARIRALMAERPFGKNGDFDLGEKSFMTDEVNQLPSSPREDPLKESPLRDDSSNHGGDPEDRIPKEGKTIMSTRSGEVAFYKATFHADLRFPIHPTIRSILHFYNICPTQLVPNTWRSIVYAVVVWRYYKCTLSLNEFRCLYSLFTNPKPDSRWLYFKVRPGRIITKGYPRNVKGWKRRFFFISRDDWEFSPGISREEGVLRVPRSWGTLGKRCNKLHILTDLKDRRLKKVFKNPIRDNIEDKSIEEEAVVVGYEGESYHSRDERSQGMSKRICLKKLAQKAEKSKGESSATKKPTLAKGVVIGEKCPREASDTSPNKKGKPVFIAKDKGTTSPLVTKRREGTSVNLVTSLGPKAMMLRSFAVAKKLLEAVIPPFDKEVVEKLDLDQVVSKFFHIIGQTVVVRSSLSSCSQVIRDEVTLQQGGATFLEGDMTHTQNSIAELDKQMAKLKMVVADLRDREARSKKLAVEEFKSLDDFYEAVEMTASRFYEGGKIWLLGIGFSELGACLMAMFHLGVDVKLTRLNRPLKEPFQGEVAREFVSKANQSTQQ